jgi:hypothetical protein
MTKRSRLETAFETRLRERARQREESKHFFAGEPRNRTERRLMGDTTASRAVPKFRTVEEADRWMEKQERIAYRQRALMTEPQDANVAGVWPAVWRRGESASPHMHEVDMVAEWF